MFRRRVAVHYLRHQIFQIAHVSEIKAFIGSQDGHVRVGFHGMATDIAAMVASRAFDYLDAPPQMVTAPHTPVPYSRDLESLYIPDAPRVIAAAKVTLGKA